MVGGWCEAIFNILVAVIFDIYYMQHFLRLCVCVFLPILRLFLLRQSISNDFDIIFAAQLGSYHTYKQNSDNSALNA